MTDVTRKLCGRTNCALCYEGPVHSLCIDPRRTSSYFCSVYNAALQAKIRPVESVSVYFCEFMACILEKYGLLD